MDKKDRTKDVLIEQSINFDQLLLSTNVLSGLKNHGFQKPSPIQLKAIPMGKCGFDLIIKSKSGTGKTAVFAIISLEMLNLSKDQVQVLILAPTREIAVQISDEINKIGSCMNGLQCAYFIGGLPLENDIKNLKKCHIAVGAPGRIKHLIDSKALKTESIKLFVLDEADKLMENSYQTDINYIYHKLPQDKQMLALSATYPDELDTFLSKYMHSPTRLSPESESLLLLGLKHFIAIIKYHANVVQQMNIKINELVNILSKISFTQCIIFTNFQSRAEMICTSLNSKDWKSIYISGSQTQEQRLETLKKLKDFETRILLTTDLTARGIDAVNVDLVINFDVPHDTSTYLHRMGRAGRYGSKGICITLASLGKEVEQVQTILGVLGGSELSMPKLDVTNIPLNIWDTSPDQFEFIYGAEDCKGKDEKSLREENIKKSINELKNISLSTMDKNTKSKKKKSSNSGSTDKCTSNLQKSKDFDPVLLLQSMANAEISNVNTETTCDSKSQKNLDPVLLLQTMANAEINNEKSKTKCDSKSQVSKNAIPDLDSFTLLQSMANGEANPSPSILSELQDGESNAFYDSPNKRKRNETGLNTTSPLPDEKRKVSNNEQEIFLKNVSMFDVTTILHDDNFLEHNERMVDSIESYIERLKCNEIESDAGDKSETTCQVVDKKNDETSFDNIFVHAYDYAINKSSENWSDKIENLSDEASNQEEISEFSTIDNEALDDQDKSYVKSSLARTHKNDKQVAKFEDNQQPTLEWIPCEGYDAGLSNNYEYVNNDKFVSNFNYCGNSLYVNAYEFEDVESFDNYYAQWQQQVESVRNYVQQNIYLQEMNYYQSYKK